MHVFTTLTKNMLAWLSVCCEVQTCIWPSGFHCHSLSCSSKIQIGFTFLVPAHPGSPGERAVKWMCVTKNISADSWKCFNKVFVFYWQYNTQLHCIHKQCLSHYNTCSVGLHMVLVQYTVHINAT